MAKSSSARRLLRGALASLIALLPSPVAAAHIFGNVDGNPHQAIHTAPDGTSTLEPDPVLGIHFPTLVLNASLAVQGFDADGLDDIAGNADDWTIAFGDLSANSLRVELYRAYADTRPGYTCGTITLAADTVHHTGGAAICLTYHPHAGDPMGADARWLQVIKTNAPDPNAQRNDTLLAPFSVYIDNVGNPVGDPFYDPIGTAQAGAFFSDRPRRAFPPPGDVIDWEAQVFITTANLAARTMTIYDGAWWGFELETEAVPEPAAAALMIMIFGAAVRRAWCRTV